MKMFLFGLLMSLPAMAQQIPVTTQQQVYLQNPLLNPGFENGTQGWSVANSAAMSADTTNALSGKVSLSFSLAATANSRVESSLFVIPKAWYGQSCYVQLSYASVSALGAVPIVEDQAAGIVLQADSLPVGSGFYRRNFTCPSSGSLKFRLNRSNNSPTGLIDNVEFGIVLPNQITRWQEFTPTFTGMGTVTNIKAFWRRVGQNLEVYGRATAGTVAASGATIIFSALGVNLDTSLIVADTTKGQIFGEFGTENSRAAGYFIGARSDFTNYVYVGRQESLGALRDTNADNLMTSGEKFSFKFSVPIQGW